MPVWAGRTVRSGQVGVEFAGALYESDEGDGGSGEGAGCDGRSGGVRGGGWREVCVQGVAEGGEGGSGGGRADEETVVRVGVAGGGPLLEVGGRAECRVGGKERIEGRVTTATSVECRLLARSHGNETVEVSLNGADWGGDSVQFRYKGYV